MLQSMKRKNTSDSDSICLPVMHISVLDGCTKKKIRKKAVIPVLTFIVWIRMKQRSREKNIQLKAKIPIK